MIVLDDRLSFKEHINLQTGFELCLFWLLIRNELLLLFMTSVIFMLVFDLGRCFIVYHGVIKVISVCNRYATVKWLSLGSSNFVKSVSCFHILQVMIIFNQMHIKSLLSVDRLCVIVPNMRTAFEKKAFSSSS